MKTIAGFVIGISLVVAGCVVGWELKQWHTLIRVWGEKAAAYDYVGAEIMDRIMVELAKQKILEERRQLEESAPATRVEGERLPAYPPMNRWQHPA